MVPVSSILWVFRNKSIIVSNHSFYSRCSFAYNRANVDDIDILLEA